MDGGDNQQNQAQEVRDLTQTIRDIDINDPSRDRNETHMRDASGREIEFNED